MARVTRRSKGRDEYGVEMIASGLWSPLGFTPPYVGFLFSQILSTGGSTDLTSPILLVLSAPYPRESSAQPPQHLGQRLNHSLALLGDPAQSWTICCVQGTRVVWWAILSYETTSGAGLMGSLHWHPSRNTCYCGGAYPK